MYLDLDAGGDVNKQQNKKCLHHLALKSLSFLFNFEEDRCGTLTFIELHGVPKVES
jgi:hypothetical protein